MIRINKGLERIKNILEKLLMGICVLSLSFTMIIVFINLILRYIFNYSFGWPAELSTHLTVWICYTGIGVCISRKELIKVDVFLLKFKPKTQKIITLLYEVLMFLLVIFLFNYFLDLYEIQQRRFMISLNLRQSFGVLGAMAGLCVIIPIILLNINESVQKLLER